MSVSGNSLLHMGFLFDGASETLELFEYLLTMLLSFTTTQQWGQVDYILIDEESKMLAGTDNRQQCHWTHGMNAVGVSSTDMLRCFIVSSSWWCSNPKNIVIIRFRYVFW